MTDLTFNETDIIVAFLTDNGHRLLTLETTIRTREKTHELMNLSTGELKIHLTTEMDRLDKLTDECRSEIFQEYAKFRCARLLEFMQKLVSEGAKRP